MHICLFSFFLDICIATIWQAIVCTGQNYSFLFVCVKVTVCFLTEKKKKKSEKVLCIVLVLYHSLHCSELKRKELSGVSGRRRTKMQAKGLNAACV